MKFIILNYLVQVLQYYMDNNYLLQCISGVLSFQIKNIKSINFLLDLINWLLFFNFYDADYLKPHACSIITFQVVSFQLMWSFQIHFSTLIKPQFLYNTHIHKKIAINIEEIDEYFTAFFFRAKTVLTNDHKRVYGTYKWRYYETARKYLVVNCLQSFHLELLHPMGNIARTNEKTKKCIWPNAKIAFLWVGFLCERFTIKYGIVSPTLVY